MSLSEAILSFGLGAGDVENLCGFWSSRCFGGICSKSQFDQPQATFNSGNDCPKPRLVTCRRQQLRLGLGCFAAFPNVRP